MSWLARSIANTLKINDDDDDDVSNAKLESKQLEDTEKHLLQNDDGTSPTSPSRGVKNDLSDLTKTLTRQLWGVASFLAPPPPQQPRLESETEDLDADVISGIRSDFAEIGGKFKSGISRLSNNINVSEITKLASDFLQLGSDDEGEDEGNGEGSDSLRKGAVGVTEEVVDFSRDIAMHPDIWLEFPLPEGDDVDFDLSDAQQEHALAVERLAPRLAALRIELCPGYMSESCFWKIYFVLLHPRLNSHDAELLSTPQIVKARASLAKELNNQNPMKLDDVSGKRSYDPKDNVGSHDNEEPLSVPSPVLSTNENNEASNLEAPSFPAPVASETVKHSIESNEMQIVDKPAIKEKDVGQVKDQNLKSGFLNVGENDEDDADDWLKEESSEIGATSGVSIPIENEDDVSFSDLEEDDGEVPAPFKKSNDKDSPDWVQLGKSSSDPSKDIDIKHSDNESVNVHKTKESNDWLDVDDIDVA